VEGQAISDSGGDFHGVVYRAKATGDLTGSLEDGKFWITGAKGVGFKSNEASSLNRLYDFVQNETAVAIP
jgi:TATA-box binding protein (TBP) (component of TFIID and TFIIIB)